MQAGYKALKTNLLLPGRPPHLPAPLDGGIDRKSIDAAVRFISHMKTTGKRMIRWGMRK